MTTLYLVLVVVLILLAISDLIVGVSNDAVNFLNSAIGSKALPMKTIMIVATVGILAGATFSSGMMEVARKGIFHPQHFYFSEIMILFLAVMITDVILLDLFNTFGMPTSTTVSIVFELLGAAVGIALIKIMNDPNALDMNEYINSAKALAIISGILMSVVIAFTSGAIIQFLSRLIFSFNFEKNIKRYGGIWGGIAITAITFFILIKGAKGASFMSSDLKSAIKENSMMIILVSFVGWTIILQLISMFTKMNILKMIIFVGTFALAMAFAGNDLVNFIGVPLAGYESYTAFTESGASAEAFLMADLAGKVKTPTLFLLLAGLIMALTLWFSKKARSVTETEIGLGRQDEGEERFGSSMAARSIVRGFTNTAHTLERIMPTRLKRYIDRQFDRTAFNEKVASMGKDAPSFDMLRASVTLVVASILISIGTSLKLPLSTTYVTFMVAMGTSLADGAWGRESAVYRVSGVLAVIGGWFFTAFSAFTAAFVLAFLFSYGGVAAIAVMILIAVFLIYRTHILHKNKTREKEISREDEEDVLLTKKEVFLKASKNVIRTIDEIKIILKETFTGLTNEDRKLLNHTYEKFEKTNTRTKRLKDKVSSVIAQLEEESIESGHHYVQVADYLREITHSTWHIIKPSLEHVENNHKPLVEAQTNELIDIHSGMMDYFADIEEMITENVYAKQPGLLEKQEAILKSIEVSRKAQIKRIKTQEVGTRNSMLYLNLLAECKVLVLFGMNLLKSHRDFVNYVNGDTHS